VSSGFRDDGTKAIRFYKSNKGDDRMNENVVHAGIVSKSQKTPGIQADFVIRHQQGQPACRPNIILYVAK
jgi:hypothetical protein